MGKTSKKDRLGIHTVGAPCLRKPNREVHKITPAIKNAVGKMWQILEKVHGAGLSAPQIGVNKKIIIVNTGNIGEVITIFNPEITWQSESLSMNEEGCLSIPGALSQVWRPEEIKVKGLMMSGKVEEFEAEGIFAKALQHEIDHINGILMIDYSPGDQRKAVLDYFKVDENSIEYELLKNEPLGPPPEKCVAKPTLYDASGAIADKKKTLYDSYGRKV